MPQQLLIIGPDPFIPQSSPDHSPQPRIDFPYMKSRDQTSVLLSVPAPLAPHLLRPCYKFYTSAKIMLQGSVMTKWIRYCFMGLFVSWIMTDRNLAQHQPAFLSSSMLFVRQILSLDFKQDCEHCILSLKKQEMTCVTEVHYIVVGRGANNLEAYLLLYLS